MKKQVIITIGIVLIAYSAFAEDAKEKKEIYWQVTPNTVGWNTVKFGAPQDEEATKTSIDKLNTSQVKGELPEILFDKEKEGLLSELLLKFDSIADSFSKNAKHLDVDTIELRVVMNVEGKLVIVSGNVQGSVAIILKKKLKIGDGPKIAIP